MRASSKSPSPIRACLRSPTGSVNWPFLWSLTRGIFRKSENPTRQIVTGKREIVKGVF